jgi:hypothetical protein
MWYNANAADEVSQIKEHFNINLYEAIALLDKGYTADSLISEYGTLPKSWLLALLD